MPFPLIHGLCHPEETPSLPDTEAGSPAHHDVVEGRVRVVLDHGAIIPAARSPHQRVKL